MAMIKVRRFDDASAPDLDGQSGTLITVLDAVLVNGYGSKSALGWTKAYSGTNKAAYRVDTTDGTGFYFRIDDSHGTYADVRGYETMTDVDTGGNPFPGTSAFRYIVKSDTASSATRAWVMYGDNSGVWLILYQTVSTLGSSSYAGAYYLGDFITRASGDTYNCLLAAHSGTTGFTYFPYFSSIGYAARKADGTGAGGYNLIYMLKGPGGSSSYFGNDGIQSATWNDEVLYASIGGLSENSTGSQYRGDLPALYQSMHDYVYMNNDEQYNQFRYHYIRSGAGTGNPAGFFIDLGRDFRTYPR